MAGLIRALRLLALVVWVGGLVFFAFVVAPVAFTVLPSTHIAGTVVAGTLGVLNTIGLVCGVLILVACAILWTEARTGPDSPAAARTAHLLTVELWLVLIMLVATAYVKWSIVPAMERDRVAAGGDVSAVPATNPARLDFERLHPISEKVEGTALLLGLGTVILVALERAA